MQLAQVIEGFFIVRRTQLAAATQRNYRCCFDKLLAFFGADKPFAGITKLDIYRFLDHLANTGLSKHSLHDNLAICAILWSFANKEFGYPHVVTGIEKPKFRKPTIVPFTMDEIKKLVKAAEWKAVFDSKTGKQVRAKRPTARRDVAVILTLLDTGLRASELCGLCLGDYQQDNGRLHVRHGKGDKERYVYLGDRAHRALWRHLVACQRTKPSDPLFASRSGGPLERNNLRHLLNRVGKNAGVADVHPHRFRHTFAIEFLRNGGNIYELQRLLGHESLETVKVYLSLAETDIERAQRAHSPADNWHL